jgi:hypothetical protein
MKFLRNKRWVVGLGALAALAAVTLFVVLPGFAATSTGYNGATTLGAPAPYPAYVASGGNNNCTVLKNAGAKVGTDETLVTNPKAVSGKPQVLTAKNGQQVTLTVTVDKTYTYLNFAMSGGIVTDVGIKGGNGTDWYSYDSVSDGGITSDTGLTAPAQTANNAAPYYGLSQTVFCWTPKIGCAPNTAISDPKNPGETVELPSCAGKDTVYFDFNSYTSGGNNYVSVYAHGGTGTPTTPMVEHITGTLPNSTQPTLQYTDIDPADPANLHNMRLCQIDPRAGGADPLALTPLYKSISNSSLVLPAADPADPEDSSCLITSSTWVDTSKIAHFEAYVYTDIDGFRGY